MIWRDSNNKCYIVCPAGSSQPVTSIILAQSSCEVCLPIVVVCDGHSSLAEWTFHSSASPLGCPWHLQRRKITSNLETKRVTWFLIKKHRGYDKWNSSDCTAEAVSELRESFRTLTCTRSKHAKTLAFMFSLAHLRKQINSYLIVFASSIDIMVVCLRYCHPSLFCYLLMQ